MAFELIILGALIFIFIVSFCGLLQKIKQTYERERVIAAQMLADRIVRRREQEIMRDRSGSRSDSFTEVYLNPTFVGEGVFPGAPPAYSQFYAEPPPKYDEVVKVHGIDSSPLPSQDTFVNIPPSEHPNIYSEVRTISSEVSNNERRTSEESNPPPPYTIAISSSA